MSESEIMQVVFSSPVRLAGSYKLPFSLVCPCS